MKKLVLIIVSFIALVNANEEDVEQKKRGAGKANSLNAIHTGAQKTDYTYSIYSQNPSSQSSPTPSYQSQIPNSFYPSTNSNQYYTPANPPNDPSYGYPQQHQINLITPQSSQFLPLNYGYQPKYQIVPSKASGGNVQLAVIPPQFSSASIVPYPQQLFNPSSNQISPHQSVINPISPHHYNFASLQPLSLGPSFVSQPSSMVLFSQPNPSPYNNLLYSNPLQSVYNYYPSNAAAKYGVTYAQTPPSVGYDNLSGSVSQNSPKEDNEVSVNKSDYLSSSDTSASYKSAYVPSISSSYSKQ